MAELAFETVVRVFIAVIILSLISIILSSIFQNLEKKVDVELDKNIELPVVVDGASLTGEDFESYAKTCRDYFHENTPLYSIEPCFIFKHANRDGLLELEDSDLAYVEVKSLSINAIMSYDAVRDKVIVE